MDERFTCQKELSMRSLLTKFAAATIAILLIAPSANAREMEVRPSNGLPFGGFASENVTWLKNIYLPSVETATFLDGYLYVTSNAEGMLIFDLSDPLDPVQVGQVLLPHIFENESVATNGKIALISTGSAPGYLAGTDSGLVSVVDVTDKSDPVVIGRVLGGADHTLECLLDCTWAYGPSGTIIDLRDPNDPVLMQESWTGALPHQTYHDLFEVTPGYILAAGWPQTFYIDATKPMAPVMLAQTPMNVTGSQHNVLWPNAGKDKFILGADEFGFTGNGTCAAADQIYEANNGRDVVMRAWDASKWRQTRTFMPLDSWAPSDGTWTDGNPAIGPGGCQTHYLDPHPTFFNGGLIVEAAQGHGARFLELSKDGHWSEVGYFLPPMNITWGAYWVSDSVVYVTSPDRGIDIITFHSAGASATGPVKVESEEVSTQQ
jgi:LVIVD repeat